MCLNYSPYCCPEVSRLLSLSCKSSVLTLDQVSSDILSLASSLSAFHLEVLLYRTPTVPLLRREIYWHPLCFCSLLYCCQMDGYLVFFLSSGQPCVQGAQGIVILTSLIDDFSFTHSFSLRLSQLFFCGCHPLARVSCSLGAMVQKWPGDPYGAIRARCVCG